MDKLQTILVDRDDFYSTVVDMVLYNFDLDPTKHLRNQDELKRWLQYQQKNPIKDLETIFIIDEFFMINSQDMLAVLQSIREIFPKSKLISYATSLPEEIIGKEFYQYFAEKTGKSPDKTITSAISQITGKTFNAVKSDPEYQ